MATIDTTKLLATSTPEDRAAECKAIMDKLSEADLVKIDATLASLKAVIADKSKQAANGRAGALGFLCALHAKFGHAAESVLVPLLPDALEALADKLKPVSFEADKFAQSLISKLSEHGVKSVMPMLLAEYESKWQTNLGRAQLIGMIAKAFPAQTGRCINDIIPVLSTLMWDVKPQVKEEATAAMQTCAATCKNKDIKDTIPEIIQCILEPEKVAETVHKLAGVVFVQDIEGSALAIMCPLLKRGMDEPTTSIKRNVARIVENMSKLVDDPYEIEPFVPILLPQLKRAKEEVSDPECRNVCEKAYSQLELTSKKAPIWARIERAKVLASLNTAAAGAKLHEATANYAVGLALSMLDLKLLDEALWKTALTPHLKLTLPAAKIEGVVKSWLEVCAKDVHIEEEKEEVDDAEQLCDCQFSLAYGNKVLLNQTVLKLKRGFRYGLCGKNDSGKTSLMRAIANQQVEGFPPPTELRTMFVETDVQGEAKDGSGKLLSELSVLDFVANHAGLKHYGVTEAMAREKLLSVGFAEDATPNPDGTMPAADLTKQVGRLSGGWRMKVALTRAMLMKADILLLDEPTNHLDPGNVKWVIDYLTSLTHVTSIIVSHDIKVLDQVCTHVLHIENLKLKMFKGNLSYVAENHVPALLSYFELKATKFHMRFPTPGMLEGVSSKGKHIMKMTNISFTYPGAPKAQLTGVTVRVSLATRAACIGANGAGKSTMIKLLTGELEPDKGSGEVWKHPNARVAYVAQHAFHHIEHHLDLTPNEYIRWRYEHGSDKEGVEKVTTKLTPEDEEAMKKPFIIDVEAVDKNGAKVIKQEKRVFNRFTDGRRQMQKSKEQEYEINWVGDMNFTTWVSRAKLVAAGPVWVKLLKHCDERIAAKATQLVRPLTQKVVEGHLADVGLEAEFATHSRMGALSGGQKVKVVLAGSMWNTPHIVILDEPTNYLDRDSLGAMAEAINAYEGGIVIISHNAQFVDQVCPEVWHLENHTLNLKGSYDWLESANKEAAKLEKQADSYIDGQGNEIKVQKAKKPASKAELKKIKKEIADKRKSGIECYTDEELEAAGFLVEQ
ncbi:ABC cassette-containing protein [Chrysochromulina tobinii]|uniref:ABC cassette-containing protein n=1 Tax=Chrysochromulina tobinii TaxID=1460289 RepID=A0A0M0LRB6_9EUKA|nr:ABC cassette-containing protein [Chrysochromulina tobinii]|eukprot:KOO53521.1 ABC cassette-containing protein [Chrysochromulina sp. CCMP291]